MTSVRFDMGRAKAEFTAAGLDFTPAPTYLARNKFNGLYDLAPSISSLQDSHYAFYEFLANAVLQLGF